MLNLANTLSFIKKWWKKNNLAKNDFESFFKKDPNEIIGSGMSMCIQGVISKYFMAVSKHFNRAYNKLDSDIKYDIIAPEELKKYRIQLRLNKPAYIFAKEIFKGEIL